MVEFDCGERKKWDSESDRQSCLVRDLGLVLMAI